MKAAVYYENGGPDVFRYEDVPDPELRPGGVLIEVAAVGIQGGDLLHRTGSPLARVPHVVGYQAAGTIVAAGERATGVAVGDRVVVTCNDGSHAALISAPAGATYRVPDSLSLEEAACVPIEFATASDCLFEFGHMRPGEVVLIQAGAGGVGLAAIQLAKAAGAGMVLATASSRERLDRLAGFGMDHGIDYVHDDLVTEVTRLTEHHGADLVVDSVGGRTLEQSIAALAYRGRISWVGRAGRDDRPAEVWPLMQKNASLTGVFLGVEMALNPTRVRPLVEDLIARVATGELRVVIDRTFPLAEAAEAHRYIESRQAFGRVVLVP